MLILWLLTHLAAVASAPETMQQQFDAANAALARGNPAVALAGFERIAARPALSERTRTLVKLRAGVALYQLGRLDAADATLREGLAASSASDSALADFRLAATEDVAAIAEDRLDLVAAAEGYAQVASAYAAQAATGASNTEREDARALLADASAKQIRTTLFFDPDKAIALSDQALAVAHQQRPPATTVAELYRLRGLAQIATGKFAAARDSLLASIALDPAGPAVASDLALLARLAPDVGKLPPRLKAGLDLPAEFYPPTPAAPRCGEAGLTDGDFGVVQLQIADDGTVFHVRPVYASAGSAAALRFARAVEAWHWPAQSGKLGVPLFYRLGTRVEVRCIGMP